MKFCSPTCKPLPYGTEKIIAICLLLTYLLVTTSALPKFHLANHRPSKNSSKLILSGTSTPVQFNAKNKIAPTKKQEQFSDSKKVASVNVSTSMKNLKPKAKEGSIAVNSSKAVYTNGTLMGPNTTFDTCSHLNRTLQEAKEELKTVKNDTDITIAVCSKVLNELELVFPSWSNCSVNNSLTNLITSYEAIRLICRDFPDTAQLHKNSMGQSDSNNINLNKFAFKDESGPKKHVKLLDRPSMANSLFVGKFLAVLSLGLFMLFSY